MKFIKQDLLTLLIGLFLFSSCKNASTIGFQPDPSYEIKGTLQDSLTVKQVTMQDDPTSTLGMPRHPLGFINDPVFGSTEASLAMSVMLPLEGYTFGEGNVLDSAILTLPYSTQFYGDTVNSVYSLSVRQLKDDLSLQKTFLSNKEWPVENTVIGTFMGKLRPKTSVQVVDVVPGAADTLTTIVPQIRIKLDNSFIRNNILNLDSVTLSKNSKFTAAFKGLQVSVNKASSSGTGGILFINFAGTDANLEIFYKKINPDNNTEIDTIGSNFPIRITSGPIAATIKHNYTNTKVQEQLDAPNPGTPYSVTYLQALAGLKNKISFPYLKDFVQKAKGSNANAKIIINRAELVVNLSNNGTDVAPFEAAQRLSLYRYDIAGQRKNIPDNDAPSQSNPGDPDRYAGSEFAFGGFYDTTNKRYVFTVTGYIQDLIEGKTEDYGTFIAPSSYTEYNLFPSISSGARSVISTKYPLAGDKAIKLNIYYTKVD